MRLAGLLLSVAMMLTGPVAAHAVERLTVLAGPIAPYVLDAPARVGDSRRGVAVEVVAEMARRAGVEVEFVIRPWQRAQAETRAGRNLAIIPLTRLPERESRYRWIAPILSDPFYLFTNRDGIDLSSPGQADSKGQRIGVLRGGASEAHLVGGQGLSSPVRCTDEVLCARMLLEHHIELWYTRGMMAAWSFSQVGGDPRSLRRGAENRDPPMYLGGSLEFSDALATRLVAALAAMQADGTYERIVAGYR